MSDEDWLRLINSHHRRNVCVLWPWHAETEEDFEDMHLPIHKYEAEIWEVYNAMTIFVARSGERGSCCAPRGSKPIHAGCVHAADAVP